MVGTVKYDYCPKIPEPENGCSMLYDKKLCEPRQSNANT